MKGRGLVSAFLTKFFSFGRADAITIFPFVFVREKRMLQNEVLMNHERIHLVQALELLVIPFYLLYLVEFVVRFVRVMNVEAAYRSISFEQEAYKNETDQQYLKNRKRWQFMKYYRVK